MDDYMISGIDESGSISIKVIYAKTMVETARVNHNLTPTASACLGRTMIMTSMIGETLKGDNDKTTVIIKGDGPIGGIVVTSDNKMRTKGYVYDPNVDIPLKPNGKLDVSGAIGNGTLTIVKDMGLKEPYSGMINLVSGEIAEDFTYYYTKSEQSPSAIGLGVLVDTDNTIKVAGGFWINVLPNANDEVITQIENNLKSIKSVTEIFNEGNTCEDFMKLLFNNLDYKLLNDTRNTKDVKPLFYCDCSKKKISEVLSTINKDELKKIIDEDKKANITCHFCNKEYNFNEEELINIYEGGKL